MPKVETVIRFTKEELVRIISDEATKHIKDTKGSMHVEFILADAQLIGASIVFNQLKAPK